MSSSNTASHKWRFFRSGGFDQVTLSSGEDLRHLAQLDPKLWTVLNCPTTGLEFDARTAALLDSDGDGQIRVPEILAAVQWACSRVVDADLFFREPGLPVDAIAVSDEEGAALKQTASRILAYLSKDPEGVLQVSDFSDMSALFAPGNLNGDGIVTAALSSDPEVQTLLGEIIATQGPVADRSGADGVSGATLAAFFEQAASVVAWDAAGTADAASIHRLGEHTEEAALAFMSLRAKVDDYFMRCQLASFDARASDTLNPAASVYGAFATRAIARDDADIAALPLAAIAADKPLPLSGGLNPAWADAVQSLHNTVIQPLLGKRESLTAADWATVSQQLSAWLAWQSARPATAVHSLGTARLQAILAGEGRAQIEALIADDLSANGFATHVEGVERLVRFQRDLVTLLQNFVTLSDFYRGQKKAIFQVGTLYLDQRSCELVLRVNDMARHATMAPFSGCYLVYCQCERKGEAPMAIVAALTGGDVDELMVTGRNGIFYDRKGRDWRATVTKVVEQPVSLRQAFWSPYRRIASFVETQLRNFAASRDKDIEARTTTGVSVAAPAAGAPAFDIAKFAGIFAAFGLAAGALGTALAAVMGSLFSLAWWQIPLVVAAVALVISGPAMIMAYMTLRRRNLGPLLDANGWAVNTRARINVPFGASMTGVASLPAGASRSLSDPFAEKKRPWKLWLLLAVIVVGLVAGWQLGLTAGF